MRVTSLFTFFIFLLPVLALAQSATESSADTYVGGPQAPVIRSANFPNQAKWYQSSEATFSWNLPDEVTAVAAELTSASETEPQTTYRPPISELRISATELEEGIQYLSVQFRNEEKWGQYSDYKIMIDNTPPNTFNVALTNYAKEQRGVIATFFTEDELSGISYYEVLTGTSVAEKVTPEEAKRGVFVPITDVGEGQVVVRAYDNANNMREETASVFALAPLEVNPTADPLGYAVAEPASVLVAIMATLTLLMFVYMVYERQRYATGLGELRSEADDIQTEMLKVFSALREEIYDQINTINRKPRLTKKEKEAVDGLNKALEISEKLLEKEVKDLRNLL